MQCIGEGGRAGRGEAEQVEAILLQHLPLVQLFSLPLKSNDNDTLQFWKNRPLWRHLRSQIAAPARLPLPVLVLLPRAESFHAVISGTLLGVSSFGFPKMLLSPLPRPQK